MFKPPEHLNFHDTQQWGLRPPPPIRWVFHDLIEDGTIGLLVGRSNCGKGLLSMQLAASVITGRPLFGRTGVAVSPRHVILAQMEDSPEEMERRYSRLQDLLHVEPSWGGSAEDGLLRSHLQIATPNWGSEGGKNMLDVEPDIVARIWDIEHNRKEEVGLIILDTLSALAEGAEASPAKAHRVFWPACSRLRDMTGAAILIIHHLKKPTKTKPIPIMDRMSLDQVRGNIIGAARAVLHLEPLLPLEKTSVGLDSQVNFCLFGLTKPVSGPLPLPILLEQQEGLGGGFWTLHPDSEKIATYLKSPIEAERLTQEEEVLYCISQGMDAEAIKAELWPRQLQVDAAAGLKAVMNHLRNRHLWIKPGKSLELTPEGVVKVAQIKQRKMDEDHG